MRALIHDLIFHSPFAWGVLTYIWTFQLFFDIFREAPSGILLADTLTLGLVAAAYYSSSRHSCS